MKKKLYILFLVSLLLVSSVLASNPQHHLAKDERACRESNPSTIRDVACGENFDAFVIGDIITDWTVPKYFTEFVKYSNSHSPSLCQTAIANAKTPRELAFSYGICSHDITDSVSHNRFVPPVLEKVYGTNAMFHALAEEAENDLLLEQDPQLRTRLNGMISGIDGQAYEEFVPFYKNILQQNPLFQDENIDVNIDFLMAQIQGGERYTHGFGTAFVVPIEIWIIIGLVFLISAFGITFALLKKKKSIWTWVLIIVLVIPLVFIILAFYGLFSGNLFTMYQSISKPITKILPLGDWRALYDLQVSNTISFFNQGSNYILSIDDPTGINALREAEQAGKLVRFFIGFLLAGFLAILVYFGIIRKRRRRK